MKNQKTKNKNKNKKHTSQPSKMVKLSVDFLLIALVVFMASILGLMFAGYVFIYFILLAVI